MTFEEIIKKKNVQETLTVVGGIVFIFGVVLLMGQLFFGFLLMAFGLVLIAKAGYEIKKLSVAFKDVFVRKELEKIMGDVIFKPDRGFEPETVYGSLILKKEDRYHSEDYIEGTIDGRRFKSADLHLQDVRSNGKTTTVVTMFQGRFYILESPTPFETPIYVLPNRTSIFGSYEGMARIDFESIAFNDRFDVFGTDKHQVFLMMKPAFMEKLLEFSVVAKRTMFGFRGHEIFVALDTRQNSFDLRLFHEVDDRYIEEIKKEVKLIKELFVLLT
jgi:hypothetical protein